MLPFSDWSVKTDPTFDERCVVAFDLDDTLTTHGALPAKVISGLEAAQAAGWLTVLVTGRPAGWADALVKLLPLDGIVSENGSVLFVWEGRKASRKERQEPLKLYWNPGGAYLAQPPAGIRDRHAAAARDILEAYPRARVASDQPYRVYDLAIDFAEEVEPPLSLADAEGIARVFAKLGATAKVSSIHVNGWWGEFSKENGLRELLRHFEGLTPERHVVYAGDSPNDGPLFKVAGVSVGVANVKPFVGMKGFEAPRYVTTGERSEGALEILSRVSALKRKNTQSPSERP